MDNFYLTATKEFSWDCAHALSGHEGLCKNLHGHTYKMLVTATKRDTDVIADGPSAGMVVDFKDLKRYVEELIVKPIDHSTVINIMSTDAFDIELYNLLYQHDKKVFVVKYRPTAENMAKHFMSELNERLRDSASNFYISRLRVYETPTSYAEVSL